MLYTIGMSFLTVISLCALALAIYVVTRWPRHARQLLFGALFSLPIVVIEFIAVGRFDRLGITGVQAGVYLGSLLVGVASLGGLAAVVASLTVNRWISPTANQRRHHLWWLAGGLGVSLGAWLAGLSLGFSLMIGLAVNSIIIAWLDWDLVWDAVVGSVAFAVWFGLADILFGVRSSGDIHQLLLATRPLGLTLAGLPIERVLVGLMAGGLIGPLFAATKFRRSPDVPVGRSAPAAKVVSGVVLTIVVTSLMAWTASAFVFPPAVASVQPAPQPAAGATLISIQFNRPIERQTIHLTSTPPIDGTWEFGQPSWSDHGFRQARFIIDSPLLPGTTYQVVVDGVQSVWGFGGRSLPFSFEVPAVTSTQPLPAPLPVIVNVPAEPVVTPTPSPAPTPTPAPTPVVTTSVSRVVLSVAEDYQDQPLSCEAAAAKMALAAHGVHVTEKQIMDIVGYDPTPHVGNVWGNPNVAFVGNIAGKQDTSGYGVYWKPIARALTHWRQATAFSGWTPSQLAQAISDGNPVVIWGVIGRAYRDDWFLPNGDRVVAWHGEHARTVIGFVGTISDPTSFIINDPVAGRITWTTAALKRNWSSFGNSGVVVY